MMNFLRILSIVLLAVLTTACGGGGGSPGAVAGRNTSTPGATVTDFALFTDKTTITNSGADKAQLTVVAVDSNRNVVPGAKVIVAADKNSVFTPTAAGSVTDAS